MNETNYQRCHRHLGGQERATAIACKLLLRDGAPRSETVKELRQETDMPLLECAKMMRCMWRDMECERLRAENAKLRTQLADVTVSMGRVEERCAKLRVERDEWHRVAVSKQDSIDHMRNANAENAHLMKLLHALAVCADDHADCDRCPINGSFYGGVSQAFCDQMAGELRRLGMEVGA